jgi:hypothetical protein
MCAVLESEFSEFWSTWRKFSMKREMSIAGKLVFQKKS